jgi:hypothetical protein
VKNAEMVAATGARLMAETMFADVREQVGAENSYRPMSGLAVAGLLLGCLSVAALLGRPLWSVPLAAAVVNLAAWRQVGGNVRRGARLCRAGLLLAVFFLSAAVVSDWFREWQIAGQSQRVADQWINALLAGHEEIAHQLSLEPGKRQIDAGELSPAELKQRYDEDSQLAQERDAYRGNELVGKIKLLQDHFKAASPPKLKSQTTDNYREVMVFEYEFEREENGERQVISFPLLRARQHSPYVSGWQVNVGVTSDMPKAEMPPPS